MKNILVYILLAAAGFVSGNVYGTYKAKLNQLQPFCATLKTNGVELTVDSMFIVSTNNGQILGILRNEDVEAMKNDPNVQVHECK